MPRFLPYLAIGGLLLTAGCGHHAAPTAVPTSAGSSRLPSGAPAPSPSGPAASADDPPGAIGCSRLAAAIEGATLMDPAVIDGVAAASGTADAPVADAAQRLATAYASAVVAKGAADEPDKIAAVSAAAADMAGVCEDSGLETVG